MATEVEATLDFENDRDASLKLIDWFEIDRVRAAKIMVVGAGAIGNEVLKNLALLGIGHIYIVDCDTVEMSNLSRSILYRAGDAGNLKAEAASRAVREINPSVSVVWQNGDVRWDIGFGLFRRMDVIIGCLDNRHARMAINRKCWKVNRPWIDAGIGVLNGQVAVFRPGESGCYECSFSQQEYEQVSMPCNRLASLYAREGRIPTMPTIASLVAAVQVQEALKLLDPGRWRQRSLVGREFVFNGTNADVAILGRPFNEICPAHTLIDQATIVELSEYGTHNTTAAQLLAVARDRLGPSAHVELNFDMIVERRCRGCPGVTRFLRPFDSVYFEELTCDHCGGQGYEVLTKNLGLEVRDYEEDFLDRTLGELGVPPLDILRAYGEGGEQTYFELTGDCASALDFARYNSAEP